MLLYIYKALCKPNLQAEAAHGAEQNTDQWWDLSLRPTEKGTKKPTKEQGCLNKGEILFECFGFLIINC